MKKFFKNLWEKISSFFKKFNYKIGFVSKGIKGDNVVGNRYSLIFPSLFISDIENSKEIGIIWFTFGIKLMITKK